MSSASQWNERYAARQYWSGDANPTLVSHAADLTPGTALDVGCGEGGDAIWLASLGWKVRGVDFSREALERAADAAAEHSVASQCDWIQADLSVWTTNRSYELVTCHYLHEDRNVRERAWRSAAAAVAPGGTLLIVGHSPEEEPVAHGPGPDERFSADEVIEVAGLGAGWDVDHFTVDREGAHATGVAHRDVVVTAIRTGK